MEPEEGAEEECVEEEGVTMDEKDGRQRRGQRRMAIVDKVEGTEF